MQAPKLPVRENDAGQVFVANLSRVPIDSVDEFDTLYAYVYPPIPRSSSPSFPSFQTN